MGGTGAHRKEDSRRKGLGRSLVLHHSLDNLVNDSELFFRCLLQKFDDPGICSFHVSALHFFIDTIVEHTFFPVNANSLKFCIHLYMTSSLPHSISLSVPAGTPLAADKFSLEVSFKIFLYFGDACYTISLPIFW